MTYEISGKLIPRKDAAKVGYDAVLWWEEETKDNKIVGRVVKLLVNLALYPKMLEMARQTVTVTADLVPDSGATYRVSKIRPYGGGDTDADTE